MPTFEQGLELANLLRGHEVPWDQVERILKGLRSPPVEEEMAYAEQVLRDAVRRIAEEEKHLPHVPIIGRTGFMNSNQFRRLFLKRNKRGGWWFFADLGSGEWAALFHRIMRRAVSKGARIECVALHDGLPGYDPRPCRFYFVRVDPAVMPFLSVSLREKMNVQWEPDKVCLVGLRHKR